MPTISSGESCQSGRNVHLVKKTNVDNDSAHIELQHGFAVFFWQHQVERVQAAPEGEDHAFATAGMEQSA